MTLNEKELRCFSINLQIKIKNNFILQNSFKEYLVEKAHSCKGYMKAK